MWINLLEANPHDELVILTQGWYKKFKLQNNFLREKEEKFQYSRKPSLSGCYNCSNETEEK